MSEKENPDDTPEEDADAELPENKGVIPKIIGFVMIFLGSLDMMLFWRGGIPMNYFYVFLFLGGWALFAFGAVRSRYHK
jgi:hypothetical protein